MLYVGKSVINHSIQNLNNVSIDVFLTEEEDRFSQPHILFEQNITTIKFQTIKAKNFSTFYVIKDCFRLLS